MFFDKSCQFEKGLVNVDVRFTAGFIKGHVMGFCKLFMYKKVRTMLIIMQFLTKR